MWFLNMYLCKVFLKIMFLLSRNLHKTPPFLLSSMGFPTILKILKANLSYKTIINYKPIILGGLKKKTCHFPWVPKTKLPKPSIGIQTLTTEGPPDPPWSPDLSIDHTCGKKFPRATRTDSHGKCLEVNHHLKKGGSFWKMINHY